jgi:alpha-tubulin suppressor-like RCC1 family protein
VEPVQVAASQYHACLRLADGRVSCAGRNNARVLGRAGGHSLIFQPVAGLSGVRSIAAGRSSSCAIKQDGTLWCWGYVTIGGDAQAFTRSEPVRVGDHNNIERVWVGESNYTICYITAAQSLFCVGNNRYYTLARQDACFNTPCAVGPSGAVGVALADEHTCVLLNDGQIYCWGNNLLGELGRGQQGEATDRPQRIQGISGFAEIGAGRRRTCARHNSGTIYCWGDAGNQFGYLGNGQHTGHSATPVQVDLINDAVGLAVGPAHACATRQGGAIYCWGAGRGYGQSRERLSPRSIGIVDNIGLVLENAVTYMLRNQHLYWLGYNYAQNPTGGGRSVTELTAWDH